MAKASHASVKHQNTFHHGVQYCAVQEDEDAYKQYRIALSLQCEVMRYQII